METEFFFIFIVTGLVLVGAEIFVPGGILGSLGAIALIGAVICGFLAFPDYGAWIALGIILMVGVAFVLWIKIFPGTRIGKSMTLSKDLADSKGAEEGLGSLIGKEGVSSSVLRPSGFATISGKRIDVVTRGEMINSGEPVMVIEVESNRVVVKAVAKQKEA